MPVQNIDRPLDDPVIEGQMGAPDMAVIQRSNDTRAGRREEINAILAQVETKVARR